MHTARYSQRTQSINGTDDNEIGPHHKKQERKTNRLKDKRRTSQRNNAEQEFENARKDDVSDIGPPPTHPRNKIRGRDQRNNLVHAIEHETKNGVADGVNEIGFPPQKRNQRNNVEHKIENERENDANEIEPSPPHTPKQRMKESMEWRRT